MSQFTIDFTPKPIAGKKTARLAIPCSDEMLNVHIDMRSGSSSNTPMRRI